MAIKTIPNKAQGEKQQKNIKSFSDFYDHITKSNLYVI